MSPQHEATSRGSTSESLTGQHLILYDGACGLCNRFVRFVIARDPHGVFHFAPLQDEGTGALLRRHGVSTASMDTSYVVTAWNSDHADLLDRSQCVLFVMRKLGWPWKILGATAILPASLRDWIYDRIAKRRRLFFKPQDACAIVRPEHRDRFRTLPA